MAQSQKFRWVYSIEIRLNRATNRKVKCIKIYAERNTTLRAITAPTYKQPHKLSQLQNTLLNVLTNTVLAIKKQIETKFRWITFKCFVYSRILNSSSSNPICWQVKNALILPFKSDFEIAKKTRVKVHYEQRQKIIYTKQNLVYACQKFCYFQEIVLLDAYTNITDFFSNNINIDFIFLLEMRPNS